MAELNVRHVEVAFNGSEGITFSLKSKDVNVSGELIKECNKVL